MKTLVVRLMAAVAVLSLMLISACKPQFTIENCLNSDDCFAGERCVAGVCIPPTTGTDAGEVDMSADAEPDAQVAAVAEVVVSPGMTTLDLLEEVDLTALLFDEDGNELSGRTVTWSSSDELVAAVDDDGSVQALSEGLVTITASAEGVDGTATVSVVKKAVATVSLAPSSSSLGIGASLQLIATIRDSLGGSLQGREVQWTSSDRMIATVSTTGLVTAVGEGEAIITARVEGIGGTSTITVVPDPVDSIVIMPASTQVEVNETTQLEATTFDEGGNELSDRSITWSSSDTSVATIDDQGVVSALTVGTTMITASAEGKTANATVEVIPQPVATVDVAPSSANLLPTETVQLAATPRASNGDDLTGRLVTWMSNDTGVATVDGQGLVTAVAPGSTTITVTSETAFTNVQITVRVPIATVEVVGASAGGDIGAMIAFTATPKDASSNSLTGRTCSFSSGDTGVATVGASSGNVTIEGEGDTMITATCEGVSGMAAIAGYGPVATVSVTPMTPAAISVGGTIQFVATLQDASGHTLSGRAVIWDSATPAKVSVNGAGLATGLEIGTSNISAISESVTSNVVAVEVQ